MADTTQQESLMKAQAVVEEPIPERRFGKGVTKETQAQYLSRKKQAQEYIKAVNSTEQQNNNSIQSTTISREQQNIKDAERLAEKYSRTGDARILVSAVNKFGSDKKAYKYFNELRKYYANKGKKPENPFETPLGTYGVSTQEGTKLVSEPNTIGYSTPEGYKLYSTKPNKPNINNNYAPGTSFTYGEGIVSMPEKPKGIIEGVRFDLANLRYQTKNEFVKFGTGVVVSGLGGAQFIKTVFTKPSDIPKGLFQTGKKIVSGEGFPEIGKTIREEPSFAVGYVTGELLQFKAPTLIVSANDIRRTLNLEKVKTEDIIAPEYFAGQKYPQIAKGQTAGELLKEFKSQGFGYTAAPKPLSSKEVLASTSELPGLYQAPKLSPTFLKVKGEEGLVSINILPTLRPTAFKISPESFELVPGLKASQKELGSLQTAKEFYKVKAEPGKSYVPFIKTEKEAIISPGTLLEQTKSKYYFEFEGRKIPIEEYKTNNINKINKENRITSAGDINKRYYSYGRINKNKPINPYSISKSASSLSSSLLSNKSSLSKISSINYSPSIKSTSLTSKNYLNKSISYSKSASRINKSISLSKVNSISKVNNLGSSRLSIRNKLLNVKPFIKTTILRKEFNNNDITTAYRTFVKQGGKKKYIGGLLEKGTALRYGESVARSTLRATFGVEATKQKIQGKQTNYTPSAIFRGYKIQKGKKVKLQDTFIQKLGKRLSSRSEVSALQLARRNR